MRDNTHRYLPPDSRLAVQLREVCHQQNQQACQALLEHIRQNFVILKGKLEIFMQLEQQKKQTAQRT